MCNVGKQRRRCQKTGGVVDLERDDGDEADIPEMGLRPVVHVDGCAGQRPLASRGGGWGKTEPHDCMRIR